VDEKIKSITGVNQRLRSLAPRPATSQQFVLSPFSNQLLLTSKDLKKKSASAGFETTLFEPLLQARNKW
jgi:hypothetical protein